MKSNIKTKAGAILAAAALAASMAPMAAFATQPDPSWEYSSGSTEGAYNDSHPDTNLYILGTDEYPIPTESNGTLAEANFAVNVPTRINYVLSPVTYQSSGVEYTPNADLIGKKKILGPDDVTLTNYSGINAHVSDIVAEDDGIVTFCTPAQVGGIQDHVYLQMNGADLSQFVNDVNGEHSGTLAAGAWNIAAEDTFGQAGGPQVTGPGELTFATNGAWGNVSFDPTADIYIGQVQFTIAPGTATA